MRTSFQGAASGAALAVTSLFLAMPSHAAMPIEYVRVCEMYGAGYFYSAGTDSCLRLSGSARNGRYVQQPAPAFTSKPPAPPEQAVCASIGFHFQPGTKSCFDLRADKTYRTRTLASIPAGGLPATRAQLTGTGALINAQMGEAAPYAAVAIEGGFGTTDANIRTDTTLPSDSSAGGSTNSRSVAFDVRLATLMARRFAIVVGMNYLINSHSLLRVVQDNDPVSHGFDTTISLTYRRALAAYLGTMWYWPTLSSVNAGTAWKAGSGTFTTLFYAGLVYGWFDLAVLTNEAGLIRNTALSANKTGLRLGLELEYPLLFSATALDYALRPYLRAGVSGDFYSRMTAEHQANFAVYHSTVDPNVFWRIYLGLAFRFNTPSTEQVEQLSDIRLKRDIARVGKLDNGLPLYSYKYLWSDEVYVGVMAQDAAVVVPQAVIAGPDGYLRVDYSQLGTRLMTLAQWTASGRAPAN